MSAPAPPSAAACAPAPPDPSVPWTPPEAGWARLEPFASDYTGIVNRLFDQLHDVDDLHLAATGARACESRMLLGAPCNELNGGGAVDPRQARAAAIGETVERYSVAWLDPGRLLTATPAELAARGEDHVRPEELTLFTDAQLATPGFRYRPLRPDSPITWCPGRDLVADRPTWVPARLVHIRPDFPDDDHPIGYSTSNGLACGCTWEEALLGGALELVERDAFMTVWYGRLSLPLIDLDSDPALAAWLDRHAGWTGLHLSVVDLSPLAGLPAALAVVRNDNTPVAPLALGAAAACTARTAVTKAVIEAFQTRTWAKAEQRDGNVIAPDSDLARTVRYFDDHIRLSLHPGTVERCRFLDASPERRALADLPHLSQRTPGEALLEVADLLDRQGARLIAVDVTSPDVAEGGLVVAKAFAPQLQPLDVGYRHRMLGNPRLRTRAYDLGLIPRPLTVEELNPMPHPFP